MPPKPNRRGSGSGSGQSNKSTNNGPTVSPSSTGTRPYAPSISQIASSTPVATSQHTRSPSSPSSQGWTTILPKGPGRRGGNIISMASKSNQTYTAHGRPALDVPDLSIKPRPPPQPKPAQDPLPPPNDNWEEVGEYNAHLSEKIGKGSSPAPKSNDQANSGETSLPRHPLLARYETEEPEALSPWRCRPEIPSVEELLSMDVEVPPNKVEGQWESVEEYLGSHYELLREDACSSLRDITLSMKVDPTMDDKQEVCVYENVRILGCTFSNFGVGVKVSFSMNRARKKVNWTQSKRLIPGTLVCLSSDNFQDEKNIKLATVLARPVSALHLTPPEVDLLFKEDEIEIDASKQWLMIESRSSYFEAYKHTLKALQRMKVNNFPLHQHIVSLDTDVPPPNYIIEDPYFDLTSLFPDAENVAEVKRCDVLGEWPVVKETTMDPNQLNALKRMITKRLAIVQGPPGTGKTYTSVLALKALIKNMKPGDPPLIISCQTNHALDQILNKIIPFEDSVIRLGGRTQDQNEIRKRTLYEVRKTSPIKVRGNERGRAKAEMARLEKAMVDTFAPLQSDLLSPQELYDLGIITQGQRNAFLKRRNDWVSVQDDSKPDGDMTAWLDSYISPIDIQQDVYSELEEEDIEEEQLNDVQAEFLGPKADQQEFALGGKYYKMGKSFVVLGPMGVDERELQEKLKDNKVWDWPDHIRAAAYKIWEDLALKKILEKIRALNVRYAKVLKNFRIAKLERDAYILQQAKVVGMTNTGLAKYRSLVASICPRIVMIEEAAESLEGPIITSCFPSVQHLILVGDHQQLRPHCNSRELEGNPYNLGISMFERLVNNNIGFDRLKVQWRMRPEIRRLLTPIYNDLEDHSTVLDKPHIEGMGGIDVFFYWHTKPETADDGTSRMNEHEAEMIVNFTRYLHFNAVPHQNITILTFYGGQKGLIMRQLRREAELRPFVHLIKVCTVDSFQGEESDIIILSLVRSNPQDKIGFLNVRNRVCVAMSRARRGFYLFGNGRMLSNTNLLWWEISQILHTAEPKKLGFQLPITCQKHNRKLNITELSEWMENKGGCNEKCGQTLPCGHICRLKCHPFSHELSPCYETCKKTLPCCGNPCTRDCHEPCVCKRCKKPEASAKSLENSTQTSSQRPGSNDVRLENISSNDNGTKRPYTNQDEGPARQTIIYTHECDATGSMTLSKVVRQQTVMSLREQPDAAAKAISPKVASKTSIPGPASSPAGPGVVSHAWPKPGERPTPQKAPSTSKKAKAASAPAAPSPKTPASAPSPPDLLVDDPPLVEVPPLIDLEDEILVPSNVNIKWEWDAAIGAQDGVSEV